MTITFFMHDLDSSPVLLFLAHGHGSLRTVLGTVWVPLGISHREDLNPLDMIQLLT